MYSKIPSITLLISVVYAGDLGGHEILGGHGGNLGDHGGDIGGYGDAIGGHGGGLSGHGGEFHRVGEGYSHEEQHTPQPYKFGYKVNEEWGQQHREEQADGHGNVVGSYGFTDAHGIYRQVDYVADKFGFRAQVKTNEPGTAPSSPADTHIESSAQQHVPHPETVGYEEGHHDSEA